jgi:hypothetical protein
MRIPVLLLSVSLVTSVVAPSAESTPANFEIVTLSNRADLISGGDALVEVRVPQNVPLKKVTLTLNGYDVTAAFVTNATARTMRGVLSGLVVGENQFLADSNGNGNGRPRATLTILNHPIGGPVLLGSQTTPWVCATPTPVAESGNTPRSNASGLTTFAVGAKCLQTQFRPRSSLVASAGAISKLRYAKFVAASLAYMALQQHDPVGLIAFDSKIRSYRPASSRSGSLTGMIGLSMIGTFAAVVIITRSSSGTIKMRCPPQPNAATQLACLPFAIERPIHH